MQTQIRITGELSPCKTCGKQPKFYSERFDQSFFGECSPCAIKTGKFPTRQEAVQAWEDAHLSAIVGRVA